MAYTSATIIIYPFLSPAKGRHGIEFPNMTCHVMSCLTASRITVDVDVEKPTLVVQRFV